LSNLSSPVVIVNFKAYREVEGHRALSVALACQQVAEETGTSIVVCPPTVELSQVASQVRIPVMAQHIDAKAPGSATGWITAEMARAAGAVGTLVNHSEHRLVLSDISAIVASCKASGLRSCICAESAEESGAVAFFKPEIVAIEPPELIGGDVSVTDAKPDVVQKAVDAVRRVDASIPVLCGAGVKTWKDVKKAIELGAEGVLLASGVIKSADPKKALEDLVRCI
jgi:triosephosphate isomerase (TIM)